MGFLRSLSPFRALRDLRGYLLARPRHELVFLIAALIITWVMITFFAIDSRVAAPYRAPEIVYVEQWPANRSEAQILAQQKIDGPKEKAAQAALDRAQAERTAEFKRLDDKLKRWGI